MSNFLEQLAERGFIVSKKCLTGDFVGLYIDEKNKKWTITGSSLPKLKRFDFSQIISCDLSVQTSSTVSGKTGGAIAGGILAGAAGAVIGSSGKRRVNENIESSCVKITVNDIKNPLITFQTGWDVDVAEEMVALFAWMRENAWPLPR